MVLAAGIVAAELAVLAAMLLLRQPKLILLAVVAGLPIEYFGTQTLGSLGQSGVSGAIRALLNPGKLAMLVTIGVVIVRERHSLSRLIPNSSTVVPLLLLLALSVLGLAWSDSIRPTNAVLILPMYIAFVFAAPTLIEDRRDVERLAGMFLLVCAGLAVIALIQRPLGYFQWRQVLVQSDGYSYRSNATFADPNHLARYMAICISLAAGLILATGPRRTTLYLAIPMLVVVAPAILVTASRSGWGMTVICGAIVVLSAPIERATKVKLSTIAAGGLVAVVALLLVQGGENAERVRTLASPVTALGQRDFLIRVGWQEFLDNPWMGVGTGNFQHALISSYRSLIPAWAETTLSHTAIVTLLAEWGLIGLGMFVFLCVRVAITVGRSYHYASSAYTRLVTGWLGASLFGILLHSQSEGRLFDDPYVYLLLAMLVAIETGPAFQRSPQPAVSNHEDVLNHQDTKATQRPERPGGPREALSPSP